MHYFGKRFLSTHLNRWISPDPLEVHQIGSGEPNVYAYVSGQVLKATDPLGLAAGGDRAIRVNSAPEGVKPGQRFIPVPAGQGGEVTPGKFAEATKGRQVFIYDPKGGLDPDIATAIAARGQELGGKNSPVQGFLIGAALASGETPDSIQTGGAGDPGGVPGGQCTGKSCIKGPAAQLVYVVMAVGTLLTGGGAKKKAAQEVGEQGAEGAARGARTLREWLKDAPELLAEAREMFRKSPEWQGIHPDETPVFYRGQEDVAKIRAMAGESGGHHPHGLALGGPPGQKLTPTGETRTVKNQAHTNATSLQRKIINVVKKKK